MKHKRFTPNTRGEVNLLVVALGVLVVFVLIFAGLFVSSYMKAQSATKNLNAKRAEAYNQGKEAGAKTQKETDEAAAKAAAENPFASYTAPSAAGDFVVKYPKSWSAWVQEANTGTQVDFIATPEIVKVLPSDSVNYAIHITLVDRPYTQSKQTYDQQVKSKKAKATTVKVSGIDGTRYEGQYTQKKSGVIVLIPVRDKTIMFATENTKYLPQFQEMLTQSTIKP